MCCCLTIFISLKGIFEMPFSEKIKETEAVLTGNKYFFFVLPVLFPAFIPKIPAIDC